MLTFTLPAALCDVVRSNQSLLYNLLFRVSAAATQHLAQDPRFIGGQPGLVGILHTWGRNLAYHPHIHYLIPAGGLATITQAWLPAQQDFLLPVKVLSKIFRGKFRQALIKTPLFARYLPRFGSRIGSFIFRYHATDTGQLKLWTLSAEEFIRRFLQHVLPKGFVKVRYFSFFVPGCRKRLATLRQRLDLIYLSCAKKTEAIQGHQIQHQPQSCVAQAAVSH